MVHVPILHFVAVQSEPFLLASDDPVFIVSGLAGIIHNWSLLWRWSTISARLKLVLKIAAGRDILFGICLAGEAVSTGVLALGHCRYYKVSPGAVVISTIETDPGRRGQGLAARSIMGAMNAMIAKGCTEFYIDTRSDNIAMQKVIEKLAIWQPLACETTVRSHAARTHPDDAPKTA
jgi:RimJ/RimL family protein N-acetyltransferase